MAIRSSVPQQCHLRKDGDPSLNQLRKDLEVVETYEDESHLMRRLEKCRKCGQLYVYEFKEEIDWVGGNDPQYLTWIPVDDEESGKEMSALNYLEILRFPSIRCDFPSEAKSPSEPKWVGTT